MRNLQRIIALLLAAVCAYAQQSGPATSATPTISRQSELVLVPVVVTDKQGHHVPGLKPEAFRVEENGKPQPVKIFEEVATAPVNQAVSPAPLQGYSNFGAADRRARRVIILVLDTINTPFLFQANARKELIKYISTSLDGNEPVTLLGINGSGMRQLHSFTTDTRLLIAALKKVQGQFSAEEGLDNPMLDATGAAAADPQMDSIVARMSEFLQDSEDTMKAFYQRDATRRTLAAFDQIAQAYAGIPGRKTLVWASAGFPFMIDDPAAFAHMGADMVDAYEHTWRLLMSANIAVYPVDVQGLMPPNLARFPARSNTTTGGLNRHQTNIRNASPRVIPYDRHMQQMDTMRAFAAATGGTPCLNNNDLAHCFARAVDDARSYYVLGFYLASDDRKPGWRKLKVRVAADAHVRAREGFYVGTPPRDDDEVRKAEVRSAVRSPLEFTGIHLNVRWTGRKPVRVIELDAAGNEKPPIEKLAAAFDLTLAPESFNIDFQNGNAVDLVVAAVAFDANGHPVGDLSRALQAKLTPESMQHIQRDGLTYQDVIELPKRAHEVRFVVRDNYSRDLGSVIAPLEDTSK